MDNQTTVQNPSRPVGKLKTNRGLLKFILFNIITLGIYSLVFTSSISDDVNIVCSRYDGGKTMHFCLMFFIVGPLTLGIGFIVWFHNISDRIGRELVRRSVPYAFSSTDFWLWNVLGSFIVVGPLIYIHKLAKAMNYLNNDYNARG